MARAAATSAAMYASCDDARSAATTRRSLVEVEAHDVVAVAVPVAEPHRPPTVGQLTGAPALGELLGRHRHAAVGEVAPDRLVDRCAATGPAAPDAGRCSAPARSPGPVRRTPAGRSARPTRGRRRPPWRPRPPTAPAGGAPGSRGPRARSRPGSAVRPRPPPAARPLPPPAWPAAPPRPRRDPRRPGGGSCRSARRGAR